MGLGTVARSFTLIGPDYHRLLVSNKAYLLSNPGDALPIVDLSLKGGLRMMLNPTSLRPTDDLAQRIRQQMPTSFQIGPYRLMLHHETGVIVISDPEYEPRWITTTYHEYSLLLLLFDRFIHRYDAQDYVILEDALRVVGLWTEEDRRRERQLLCKHLTKLKRYIGPWFEIQSLLTSRGLLAGYRLLLPGEALLRAQAK